jgi:large subunit ribosomal protein L30
MAKLKITLKRSLIGRPQTQRNAVRSMGLRKINSTVERPDTPAVRGQIHKIEHLVEVEEIAD